MMKKIFIVVLLISFVFISACSNTSDGEGSGKKTVKVFQLKVEIADALKKLEKDYEKEHKDVDIKFETVGGGADYGTALTAKFQTNDQPDIFNSTGYQDMDRAFDKLEDLSNEPWVKDMIEGTGDSMTRKGKLYGQPQCIEGFGFAYNETLFEKAGIKELPQTLTELENACKKLQDAGITPFVNSYAEWWVLGVHNITILLSQQPDVDKFLKGIENGSIKLKDNKIANDWINLLDLTVKYGQKNMTTAGDYKTSVTDFASGKGAMIQQGTWIQPDIDKIDKNFKTGFLTMPINDDIERSRVYIGVPQSWCVNKDSKVKKEAKEFLNWLVTSDTGKKYLVEEFKFIPAFKDIQSAKFSPLNASIMEYQRADKVYMWQIGKMPPGSTNLVGDSMKQYVSGQIDKDKLFVDIEKAIIDKSKK